MNLGLAGNPNWADTLSAIGQAAGALFTLIAIVVALAIAVRDARQRTHEGHVKAFAQARLVRAKDLNFMTIGRQDGGDRGRSYFVEVLNAGDTPILDVQLQVVFDIDGQNTLAESEREDIAASGSTVTLHLDARSKDPLLSWRITWMDANGLDWEHVSLKNGKRVYGRKDFCFESKND